MNVAVEVVGEIAGEATVDVNLGSGTALNGEDFNFDPVQLIFDPSHRTRTVTIPILANPEYEPDETIVLELNSPTGATVGSPESAVITILAQDPPPGTAVAFSSADFSFIESDDPFDFDININPALPDGSATVDVVVVGGTATRDYDYDFSDQTVTIVSTETEAWLRAWGYADDEFEGDETIILQLTNPQGIEIGSPSTATITIVDDDIPPTVAFSADTLSALESLGYFELQAYVDAPVTGTASVDVTVVGGTATPDEDFELYDTTLTYSSMVTSRWVSVEAWWDEEDEADETIILQLTNAQGLVIGEPSTATLTIIDDDAVGPAAQFDDAQLDDGYLTVSETDGIISLDVLVSPLPTGAASVDVILTDIYGADSSDFVFNPQTLSFDPLTTTASVIFEILDDNDLESSESFVLELQKPAGDRAPLPRARRG